MGKDFSRPKTGIVQVYGVGEVMVRVDDSGVSMHIKGTKKHVYGTWADVAGALKTPETVASFLYGRPIEFLKHEKKKVEDRRR